MSVQHVHSCEAVHPLLRLWLLFVFKAEKTRMLISLPENDHTFFVVSKVSEASSISDYPSVPLSKWGNRCSVFFLLFQQQFWVFRDNFSMYSLEMLKRIKIIYSLIIDRSKAPYCPGGHCNVDGPPWVITQVSSWLFIVGVKLLIRAKQSG